MADMVAFRAEMRRQAEDLASRVMASDPGQRLIAFYEQLGERDRLAVRYLGWFSAAVVAYLMAVSPLLAMLDAASRRLEEERSLLTWLQSHDQGSAAAGASAGSTGEPVAGVVNSTAEKAGLAIRRYEPSGENGVRLWMEGASFNSLVKWLFLLEGTHGIQASEFTIEREAEPGKVSVRITLHG